MGTPSQGSLASLCVEPGASAHTFDSSSEPYEILRETLTEKTEILDSNGIRGTRSRHSARTRFGLNNVGGSIVFNPSPNDLDNWLPRILGASESTDSFALADTLPVFGVLIDRVAETFEYKDCSVNRAIFRGSPGQLIELELDILAKSQATGTSYPSLTLGTANVDQPFAFTDGAFTLAGSARDTMSFELTIDNFLDARFVNSRNAGSITPQDRLISLRTTHPYTSDETDLLSQSLTGAAGTIVLTPTGGGMSGVSTTFTFGRLQNEDEDPTVPGKSEILLTLNMIARMTGSTRELVVTHDPAAA